MRCALVAMQCAARADALRIGCDAMRCAARCADCLRCNARGLVAFARYRRRHAFGHGFKVDGEGERDGWIGRRRDGWIGGQREKVKTKGFIKPLALGGCMGWIH
jgi:hypothetical protein